MFKSIDDYLIDTILKPLCRKYKQDPLVASEFFLSGYLAMLWVSVLTSAMASGFSFLFLLVILPSFGVRSVVRKCENLRKNGMKVTENDPSFREVLYYTRLILMVALPIITYLVIGSTIPSLLVLTGFWLYLTGLYLMACATTVIDAPVGDVDPSVLP